MATSYHTRSNSFPSKQHPLIADFDEKLRSLRSSQEASSSSTSIASKLNGLQDLHDCADRLLLLPLNQQALSKEQNEKWVDELLNGSLRILDLCNTTKGSLNQIKESAQEILSTMRRRRSGCCDLSTEVKKFLASRKSVKKQLRKAMESTCSLLIKKKSETVEIENMLREAMTTTVVVFESLVSFVSGPNPKQSLVSKLMNPKRVVCEEVNEFKSAEAALKVVIKAKKPDNKTEENAQNELQNLEMCIKDLEEGLESLYRRSIKTRVSLLNILNY